MQLKPYMDSLGITCAAMAKKISEGDGPACTGEAVRRWSTGQRMPSPEFAERIVEVTGGAVTIRDLHDCRLAALREEGVA